ncbi:hypothetical protein [Raoultibacter massiliensis]|uniref:hypothetical protein n=1 Tax=Raoultibacter massiliensis TaxID=1852371 RepID=UPI0011AF2D6C|nr:hypothetical protein [Raoultibacter massiliensis]
MENALEGALSTASATDGFSLTEQHLTDLMTLMGSMEMTLIFIFVAIVLLIGLVFGLCITRKWHA